MYDIVIWIFSGALIVLGSVGFARIIIKSIKEHRRQLKELVSDYETGTIGIKARVIGKRTEISYKGIKIPEHNIVYIVSFLTYNGESKEYSVTKDIYNSISEDDTGTLVTINDNFFDFGNGEEIIEKGS